MRDFTKLKTLDDWAELDRPQFIDRQELGPRPADQQILRMLIRPKYRNHFYIPRELRWLEYRIREIAAIDAATTGISSSWCYVTVRSGEPRKRTAHWHFDGPSMRADVIPERNYTWCDKFGFQFKLGGVKFPDDFDPLRHNMNTFAEEELKDEPILTADTGCWYLVSPFVFHRRDPKAEYRTFIRISFLDIEIRDETSTQNPLFHTQAYGRNPVASFRDGLTEYRRNS